MTKLKRVNYLLQAVLMLISAAVMLMYPEEGYIIILAILSTSLIIYGINQLLFYFSLARYMVGGKIILCKAVIVLNIAFEAWDLTDVPKGYVMVYLVIGLVFSGLVDVLRAMETKKNEGVRWRLKLSQGIFTILISVIGLFYLSSTRVVVYFFCFGVVSAAITRITEALRKTAVLYIR